jgi:hypothetical protein
MIAISADEDLELGHIDVKTAFLSGTLTEIIYMYPLDDGPVSALPLGMYDLSAAESPLRSEVIW